MTRKEFATEMTKYAMRDPIASILDMLESTVAERCL